MGHPRRLLGLLLAAGVVGCAAERLGVRVPPTGLDAINLEDLQRDAFALAGPQVGPRGPGQPGAAVAAEWMQQRLSQMELVPAFGRAWATPLPDGRAVVCGQRDGQRPDVIGVFAVDAGEGAVNGALPLSALISLAKSYTGRARPTHTLLFCALPEPGGLDALRAQPPLPLDGLQKVVFIGPLGDGPLRTAEGTPLEGVPVLRITTADPPPPGPDDQAEAVDYRRVLDRVRQTRGWLDASPEGAAP